MIDAVASLQGARIPASVLERDVLPARVADAAGHLDRMFASGELMWVGHGSLGLRDGKIGLYSPELFTVLWPGPDITIELSPMAQDVKSRLEESGASFFRDIYTAVGGGDIDAVSDAVWDLVWAGYASNDSLEPLRAYVRRRKSTGGGRSRLQTRFPAHTSGRWFLTERDGELPNTEHQTAVAQVLLDRYGVVTRSTVQAAEHRGGFSAVYPVLRHLEETGRIRRGYFVEGLGGSQFALPGAVDRLRSDPTDDLTVLAATDPANPYGGVVPWPETESRLARDAGAYVFIHRGNLVAYLDKGRRNLTITVDEPSIYPQLGSRLAEVASRHRRVVIHTVDDEPAPTSDIASILEEWGFAPDPKGLAYRR